MQSYEDGEIIATNTGSLDKLKGIMGNLENAHHVIGNLPKIGQIVEINGLKFRVRSVNKNGKIGLRIFTP